MELVAYKQHESNIDYSIAQDSKYTGDDYWVWSVWVDATDDALNKIDHVVYNLHYTFPNPVRIIATRNDKFRLETLGWGIFTIYARIHFKDETVLDLEHELELYYPDGEPTEN